MALRQSQPTSSELIFDALVRHQIGLMRLAGSVRGRVIDLLDATERDVRGELERRLAAIAGAGVDFGPSVTKRLKILAAAIREIRGAAWKDAGRLWRDEAMALASAEPEFIRALMVAASPVVLDFVLPSVERLKAIVLSDPFEGRVLKDWAADIARADLDRIQRAVNIGLARGEPVRGIVARVIGTGALRGRDGVTEMTRRQIEALTRTMINHVANEAKLATYTENADILSEEVYVATLDARTTITCASLDGNRYPIGEGPRPPLHFNCRSVRVAVLDGDLIGDRPAVAASKADLDGLSRKERRARVRELTGQVPAKTTYNDWLKRQSVDFQNEVLGEKRALLFRKGGLTLDRFTDRAGNELTLDELMSRERAAFERAGLI